MTDQAAMRLVPVEPTEAMVLAGARADEGEYPHFQDAYRAVYAAMLAAAPTHPTPPEVTDEAGVREALEPFAEIAHGDVYGRFKADSRSSFRISNGDGSRHLTFINAECFDAARAALRADAATDEGVKCQCGCNDDPFICIKVAGRDSREGKAAGRG